MHVQFSMQKKRTKVRWLKNHTRNLMQGHLLSVWWTFFLIRLQVLVVSHLSTNRVSYRLTFNIHTQWPWPNFPHVIQNILVWKPVLVLSFWYSTVNNMHIKDCVCCTGWKLYRGFLKILWLAVYSILYVKYIWEW